MQCILLQHRAIRCHMMLPHKVPTTSPLPPHPQNTHRVFGPHFAEVPYVSTQQGVRRAGHFRRLMQVCVLFMHGKGNSMHAYVSMCTCATKRIMHITTTPSTTSLTHAQPTPTHRHWKTLSITWVFTTSSSPLSPKPSSCGSGGAAIHA